MKKCMLILSFILVSCAGQLHGMEFGFYDLDADCAQLLRHQSVQEETNERKLWLAVIHDNIDQVKELLKAEGIDLEAKLESGMTILGVACREGNPAIVQLLLDKRANPKAPTSIQDTPLHEAAMAHCMFKNKNANFPKVVELLLAKRVDVNASDVMGSTPLHKAAYYDSAIFRVDKRVKAALCKQLLQAGADRCCKLNVRTGSYTPLHEAAVYNNPFVVQELIIFEPTREELQHLVPGVWALKQLNFPADLQEIVKRKMVSSLVTDQVAKAHAYIAMTASGKTAYMIAQDKGHAEIAKMLDMSIDASRKALRLVLISRLNELSKMKQKKDIEIEPKKLCIKKMCLLKLS